ncbi:MAG: VirB3 family type IV secretion system protein [Neisseriaceae bacterium]
MQTLNQIHKSLYMPLLFVGCERLPFTALTLICGLIIVQYQSLWAVVISIIIYLAGVILIRRINMEDMQFFQCLYRYLRFYQDYYPANAFYPGAKDRSKGII